MNLRRIYWLGTIVFVTGCTAWAPCRWRKRFGQATRASASSKAWLPNTVDYWDDVKPIVENRCVVCHACYDAPCQLKMSSIEGIERGASEPKVYTRRDLKTRADDATVRRRADAGPVAQQSSFFPVLNEFDDTPEANREAGVMYRLLKLKRDNPLPNDETAAGELDLSLDRKQSVREARTRSTNTRRKHPLDRGCRLRYRPCGGGTGCADALDRTGSDLRRQIADGPPISALHR